MNELFLATVLIGNMTITSYRSVPSQTDDSPFITSTGEHVHSNGVALSRDLLERWGGPVNYGDIIFIEGFGFKIVNDCMADYVCLDRPRPKNKQNCTKKKYQRNHVDIWVKTYKEEKAIGWQKRRVWIINTKMQGK